MMNDNLDNIPDVDSLQTRSKCLPQKLRRMFLRYLQEDVNGDAASHAHSGEILEKLIILGAQSCKKTVKVHVATAILADSNPVDVFFDCLPSAQEYEDIHETDEEPDLESKYDRACKVFKCLAVVYGKDLMMAKYGNTVLEGLFRLSDRADLLLDQPRLYDQFLAGGMLEELLCSSATILPGADLQQRHPELNEHSCALINYLSFVARGRKDSECTVQKPWDIRDPAQLRRTDAHDLSRLRFDGVPRQDPQILDAQATSLHRHCWPDAEGEQDKERRLLAQVCSVKNPEQHAVACEEAKRLYRLACLFEVAFEQFILSSTHIHRSLVAVSTVECIVEATVGGSVAIDPNSASLYAGIPADMDLSRPDVKAALYTFWCCAIKDSAQSLLEYFFRSSSADIQFLHFVPKNAHTPVKFISEYGLPTFNMVSHHTVALLTTFSGQQFILDPTAAQYGWTDNFAPQEIYTRCRIDREFDSSPCDQPDERPPTKLTLKPETRDEGEEWESRCVAEEIVELVELVGEHLNESGGLESVVQFPQAKFEEYCQTLKVVLESGMDVSRRYRAFFEGL